MESQTRCSVSGRELGLSRRGEFPPRPTPGAPDCSYSAFQQPPTPCAAEPSACSCFCQRHLPFPFLNFRDFSIWTLPSVAMYVLIQSSPLLHQAAQGLDDCDRRQRHPGVCCLLQKAAVTDRACVLQFSRSDLIQGFFRHFIFFL